MVLNTSKTKIIVAIGVLQLLMPQLGMARQACDMQFRSSGSGSNSKGRIVGGQDVREHELPYQLLLINLEKGALCGAVVLNTTHALTASHCTEGSLAYQFFLYGGIRDRREYTPDSIREDPNVQVRNVSRIIQHPRYAQKSQSAITENAYIKNDICILELSEPFEINEYVRPIKLATKDTKLPSSGVISGWGCMVQKIKECPKNPAASPRILQKATVSIHGDKECAAPLKYVNIYTYQVCVGDDGIGACSGDSGGPFAIEKGGEKLLVGIASFVVGNYACEGYPAVYTEVSHFLPWINYGIDDTPEEIVGGSGFLVAKSQIYFLTISGVTLLKCVYFNELFIIK